MVDLEKLRTAVRDALPEFKAIGVEIIFTGVRVRTNSLLVGVHELEPGDIDLLTSRFGPGIEVRDQQRAQADVCTLASCWPQKGGFKVYSIANPSVVCTSGFVAKSESGAYGLITAGHCTYKGGPLNWAHDSAAHTIGTTSGNTWLEGANADVAFIYMNYASNPPPTVKNYYLPQDGQINSLTQVVESADQLEGSVVCRTGVTWGRDCGTIFDANTDNESCINNNSVCRTIHHTWEVDFDSTGGDSGGPYNFGISTGYGTHVHSDPDGPGAHGWYSPLGWGRTAFFQQFGVFWSFCRSSNCTLVWP